VTTGRADFSRSTEYFLERDSLGLGSHHPLPTQSAKAILEFMLSFRNRRRAASLLPNYLVIVMVPLFAWAQDSPSREQAIRPMHVQKNTERFSNGRPKAEYCFYRGKDALEVLHGKYITWSESGQKLSEQNYRNGKIDGRTVYWHENGKKSWQGTYHDGYAVGTWVSWNENGQKESSCNYVNGEKEGVCLWWDAQGRKADSVEYIHGKPRAIAEWEARDQRAVKTPIYLYPSILVLPKGGLTFSSAYAGITKDFSVSQLEEVFASLPASVWVDGKSIGIQQVGLASEADHQTMDQVMEKVKAFFTGRGYRVYGVPS